MPDMIMAADWTFVRSEPWFDGGLDEGERLSFGIGFLFQTRREDRAHEADSS